MDRKTLQDKLEYLKQDSKSEPKLNESINKLINIIEELFSENERHSAENQTLKDEINRLKGEQGKPNIKGKNRKNTDISSEDERKEPTDEQEDNAENTRVNNGDKKPKKKRNRPPKLPKVKIDRVHFCPIDRDKLPDDAVFKYHSEVVIQDLKIVTDNVKYIKEVFYSPSERKTYTSNLPADVAGKGEFGVGIRTLIPLLKSSECNMSESCILKFFKNFGIEISEAYISNQWTKGYEDFHQEKENIYEAGLSSGSFQQVDDTGSRVYGENRYVQIICNPYYSAFFTTERKDRLTVLDVFRNFAPRQYLYNAHAVSILEHFALAKKLFSKVNNLLEQGVVFDEVVFDSLLDALEPGPKQRTRIKEACAIAAYREQIDWPVIEKLICDDAPQFKLLTEHLGLCWIHDGRLYKKLNPVVPLLKSILDDFLSEYWLFYHKLKRYKKAPDSVQADLLEREFVQLFATETGYQKLDERIAMTLAKRKELLLVLKYPDLPLHNNAPELCARAQKRDEDISLHTRSVKGTQIKDTFLTITQTAIKLGVRAYDYIRDRVSGEYKLPSLAQLIREKSLTDSIESSRVPLKV